MRVRRQVGALAAASLLAGGCVPPCETGSSGPGGEPSFSLLWLGDTLENADKDEYTVSATDDHTRARTQLFTSVH